MMVVQWGWRWWHSSCSNLIGTLCSGSAMREQTCEPLTHSHERVKAAEAPQEDGPAESGHLMVKIEKKRKMYKKKKEEVTVATCRLTLMRTCVYVCVTHLWCVSLGDNGAGVAILKHENLTQAGNWTFFSLLAWKNMFKTTRFDTCLRFAWMKINRCAWSDVFLRVLGTGRLGPSVSSPHHLWGNVTFLQTQMCQFPHHQVWQSGLSR